MRSRSSQAQVLRRTRRMRSPRQPAQSLGAIAARNGIVFGAAAGPVIDKDRRLSRALHRRRHESLQPTLR